MIVNEALYSNYYLAPPTHNVLVDAGSRGRIVKCQGSPSFVQLFRTKWGGAMVSELPRDAKSREFPAAEFLPAQKLHTRFPKTPFAPIVTKTLIVTTIPYNLGQEDNI
jgi:hypothetical protein